jgi:NADH:ubiquinone oxidoreductase subunit 6 (subunit J)
MSIMINQAWIIILFAVGLVISSLGVLLARRLIVMISAIGLASLFLGVVFFLFDAPYAGGFEVSVGAGLISVLFVIATSLTGDIGGFDNDDL